MTSDSAAERSPGAPSCTTRPDPSQVIAERWRAILEQEEIEEDHTFFELGGTSMTGTQLVVELSQELGLEIPLSAIYEYPTLHQFRTFVMTTLAR